MADETAQRLPAVIVISATAAIVLTVGQLPERIASHFGVDGLPNGFMPRGTYRILMLALALGVPALMTFACRAAIRCAWRIATTGSIRRAVRLPLRIGCDTRPGSAPALRHLRSECTCC